VYRSAVGLKNQLYDRSFFTIHQLPHPVISVGNLTVGGTGKTPLVAYIGHHLLSTGEPVAVLSRGYRRRDPRPFLVVSDGREILADAAEAGDEPVELARSMEKGVVAVGADRYRVGLEVVRTLGPRVFILDDGFQHRRLYRDLDIVCLDAGEEVESLRVLPAGRSREPLGSLNRAGAIVWTRFGPGRPSESLYSRVLGTLREEVPIFRAVQKAIGYSRIDGDEKLSPEELANESVGLVAAIARPARFRDDLEATGAEIVWSATRRDHHAWQPDEVRRLVEQARSRGARAVVTTGKDAVKIASLPDLALPLYRLDSRMEILEREAFETLLGSALRR
jgi:tetraacyldisaccharide 4'-kinase